MIEFNVNLWIVLIVWFIYCGIGAFWYSPAGFGKLWAKLSGVNHMKIPEKEATRALIYIIISSAIQAYALAVILKSLAVSSVSEGLLAGLFLWLGFVALTTIGTNFYMRKSWKYWWLNASFFLVVMSIGSIVLTLWG